MPPGSPKCALAYCFAEDVEHALDRSGKLRLPWATPVSSLIVTNCTPLEMHKMLLKSLSIRP